MNQIRDALDEGGALSSGSRRDALTSFSQRHLHGQALLLLLLSCGHCVMACLCMLAAVRLLELIGLRVWGQGVPDADHPYGWGEQGVQGALGAASRKHSLLHLTIALNAVFGPLR